MHFFGEMKWTPRFVLKAIGITIIVIVFASFVFSFVKYSMSGFPSGFEGKSFSFAPEMVSHGVWGVAEESYEYDKGGVRADLSVRNAIGALSQGAILPVSPRGGYSSGNTAEAFEVTEYSAQYEATESAETCNAIAVLKSYSYVIFESAHQHERGCDYRFKVEHARVSEILQYLRGLNPKDLNESTYTIQDQIDDFSSETDVLENKRRAIDETLVDAIAAYDDISAVAAETQDAESLARIIDSKIQLIERLTQQKIEINTQLDRLARARAEQLDRLNYTYMNVLVYENAYFDREDFADSWKGALQATIGDSNAALQAATLGAIAFIFIVLQWLIFGFILLIIVKYAWRWAQLIWKGKPGSIAPRNGTRRKQVGGEVGKGNG